MSIYFDVVDAPCPTDPNSTIRIGIRQERFQYFKDFGLRTAVAQYYGIVRPGLILARHVFRGLKRPLMLGGNMSADKNVLIYSWRPLWDYEWMGTPDQGYPTTKNPPLYRVFVTLVREKEPNSDGISGSIERWNWVIEDPEQPHAPIESAERYGECLWSREIP